MRVAADFAARNPVIRIIGVIDQHDRTVRRQRMRRIDAQASGPVAVGGKRVARPIAVERGKRRSLDGRLREEQAVLTKRNQVGERCIDVRSPAARRDRRGAAGSEPTAEAEIERVTLRVVDDGLRLVVKPRGPEPSM